MSKLIILLLWSFVSLWSVETYSYEEALSLQKKNHKIIMFDVVHSQCHYCIKMQKEVFDDKEMSQWLEKRFIIVENNLDFDDLPFNVSIPMTPTFIFRNENQKTVKIIHGSWGIQDFKDLTQNIK